MSFKPYTEKIKKKIGPPAATAAPRPRLGGQTDRRCTPVDRVVVNSPREQRMQKSRPLAPRTLSNRARLVKFTKVTPLSTLETPWPLLLVVDALCPMFASRRVVGCIFLSPARRLGRARRTRRARNSARPLALQITLCVQPAS